MWYPSRPADTGDANLIVATPAACKRDPITPPVDHEMWSNGSIKYTYQNRWSNNIKAEIKEASRRYRSYGVEVRTLPTNHRLHGQQGLFATTKFEKFDVVGEYTGKIVGSDVKFGEYLATLEDKDQDESLGLDASQCGNEMRCINSYLNIAFAPNVTMRTAYINTFPHIVIVATMDIEIGDEILLDYGQAYNNMYILPHLQPKVCNEYIYDRTALPGCYSDSSREFSSDEEAEEVGNS